MVYAILCMVSSQPEIVTDFVMELDSEQKYILDLQTGNCMRKALYFLGILNDSDLDWLIAVGADRAPHVRRGVGEMSFVDSD